MSNNDAINDVRRKINEVMKKTDERIVVGWRPGAEPRRTEGETWVDSEGKQWEMKNGIRIRKTKLDTAKTPWFCPQCNKAMSHRLDTKYWRIRNKCMDCVIKEETEMRRQGTWKAYEEERIKSNYIAFIKDKIQELQHLHDTVSAPEVVHADGERILMIEKWNVDIDKVKEDLAKDIEELKIVLQKVENGEEDEHLE
jgi:hypothetical protein